jgi:hypothetical protein
VATRQRHPQPVNPEYEPIVVTVDDEADIQVVAEVLEVPAGDVG